MRWEYFDYQPHARVYLLFDGSSITIQGVVHLEQCGDLHRLITETGETVVLNEWKSWRLLK